MIVSSRLTVARREGFVLRTPPYSPQVVYARLNAPLDRTDFTVSLILRKPRLDELADLSSLCLRSKAVWGYDAAFLDACREELTLTPQDVTSDVAVAERDGAAVGVAQVIFEEDVADLDKMFVDPDALGEGIGTALFAWAVAHARAYGASRLTIDAEPGAAAFYRKMGAAEVGERPSASIPGRMLPLFVYDLTEGDIP